MTPAKVTRRYGITKNGVRYEVKLTLDVEAIAKEMVNNAANNQSGKATMIHGSIKAEVIKKEPT